MTIWPPLLHPNLTGRHILAAGLILFLLLLTSRSEALVKPREILLGIEPEHNIFTQMENYRKLAGYLTGKTGIPVRPTVMSRYGEVLQRFKELHLDGALLSSYTATMALDALGMTPVARPVNLAGEAASYGLIFTRKDSGIRQLRDMRGKSFAFVDPATAEGYLFPLLYLRQNGIRNPLAYIGRNFFTGSHDSAISAVLDGRADLGAAKEAVYARQLAKDPALAKELVILARSGPLPPATLFLSNSLAPELRLGLTTALLEMAANPEGREVLRNIGALHFTRADKKDYDQVRKMAAEAGVNRDQGPAQ